MKIKKYQNGNQYILTPQNKWVRNFTINSVPFIDINETIESKDHFIFLKNETKNGSKKYPWINLEQNYHPNIVIVSDGYNFKNKQNILEKLPKSTTIIGVNGALKNWNIKKRNMNFYVVNNPYPSCLNYLPKKNNILPKCIASQRTNYEFLEVYRGSKWRYYPVNEKYYTTLGAKEVQWQIDDYRNSICAAIGLAYKFGVEKLLLFCCDDSFDGERPGSKKIENNLWMYPIQEIAHGLIDGNIYWLSKQKHKEVLIKDHSSGPNYTNASYIKEEEILSFFKDVTENEKE